MAWQGSPAVQDREVHSVSILHTNASVQSWLESLGLSEYVPLFKKYRIIEDIILLSEVDIRELGVRNGGHRARMISSLVMIRESNIRRMRPQLQEAGAIVSSQTGSSYCTVPCTTQQGSVLQPFHTSAKQQSNLGMQDADLKPNTLLGNSWYHAGISRQEAEHRVPVDGMFLVRDSFTQPGDFVLTTLWKGVHLHFVINKIIVPGQPKFMYHFEEEAFDSVTNLIQHYVCNGKPVTASSGAIISIPVPHSEYLPHSSNEMSSHSQVLTSGTKDSAGHKRTGSEPLLNFDEVVMNDKRLGSLPSIGKGVLSTTEMFGKNCQPVTQSSSNCRVGLLPGSAISVPEVEVTMARDWPKENVPPKPSRVPTIKKRSMERPNIVKRNMALYEDDGKDYSDYEQVKSLPDGKAKGEKIVSDFKSSFPNPGSGSLLSPRAVEIMANHVEDDWLKTAAKSDTNGLNSYFDDLASYKNSLLAVENKPLDLSTFMVMKALILQGDAVLLARHLTAVDLELVRVTGSHDFGFCVTSGLELMTLPQGHCLREDIIERHFSLKLFVSLMIVYCTNFSERVDMLHKWIQVAHELRSCFGNLFGFAAVMEGLLAEQVARLEKSWLTLQNQRDTSSFLFSKQLCSFLKSLNDGTSVLPLQNVTVPHILPLAEILQDDSTIERTFPPRNNRLLNFDMDSLMAHLDSARIAAERFAIYHKAAESLLEESDLEKSLIDLLSPRTHMKFLWGSKGIRASQAERFIKFEKVLTALSEKAESCSWQ